MLNFIKKCSGKDYNLNYDFKSIKFKLNNYKNVFVFTGGLAPDAKDASLFFNSSDTGNKPDFIIAADSGLDTLDLYNKKLNLSFVPDVIVGDMDSVSDEALVTKYENSSLIKFSTYKDFTDTELALILAKKACARDGRITLIGGSGARIDHLIAVFDLFATQIAPDFWLSEKQVLVLLRKKQSIKLLPSDKGSPVSVLRTTDSRRGGKIKSSGLEWESALFRSSGVASLSNVVSEAGFASKQGAEIKVIKGSFIICFDYAAKMSVSVR